MNAGLTSVDEEYIAFLAGRRDVNEDVIRAAYIRAKVRFNFASREYRNLALTIYDLFSPVYGEETDESLIVAHQFHAALHTYRHISYSYYNLPRYEAMARRLLEIIGDRTPVIVDYGCGLAYLSLAIAMIRPESMVYLVDVDSAVLDFAAYRFARRGINHETIPVTRENIYPQLPSHNICVASEVMEHLLRPLLAYRHIYEAMDEQGVLFGQFGDHEREFFHVSPDLQAVRDALVQDFRQIDKQNCFVKM